MQSHQPLPEVPGTSEVASVHAVAETLVPQSGPLVASVVADVNSQQVVEEKPSSPVSEQSCLSAVNKGLTASEQCAGSAGLTAALSRAGFISLAVDHSRNTHRSQATCAISTSAQVRAKESCGLHWMQHCFSSTTWALLVAQQAEPVRFHSRRHRSVMDAMLQNHFETPSMSEAFHGSLALSW